MADRPPESFRRSDQVNYVVCRGWR